MTATRPSACGSGSQPGQVRSTRRSSVCGGADIGGSLYDLRGSWTGWVTGLHGHHRRIGARLEPDAVSVGVAADADVGPQLVEDREPAGFFLGGDPVPVRWLAPRGAVAPVGVVAGCPAQRGPLAGLLHQPDPRVLGEVQA